MARIEYHYTNKLSMKWIFGGLICAFLLIFSSIFLFFYPFASTDKKTYFRGEHPIVFHREQLGNALLEGNTWFVPLSFLKENIDNTIMYDEKSNSVILTTSDKVVQMPTNSLTYFVNQKEVNLQLSPIITKEGKTYVALEPILSFYPIQYKKMPETGAIWIQQDGEKFMKGILTEKDMNQEKLRLRTEPSFRSPYVAEMANNEAVTIEGEKDDFYLVRKANGISGYVKKEYVQTKETVTIEIIRQNQTFSMPEINGPVKLTWEAVYSKNPDASKIPDMAGVNVVSPTWFSLAAGDGSVKNLASLDYSNWAHGKGYQVWGVFSNSFDPVLTHEAMKDFETRQAIIRQLLHFSQMYQLQGINFDIENVNQEDGPLVTQFMREAAPYLHEAGLIVSMDITFAAGSNNNWSSFYEREKLAKIADFLVVMAYDEHTGAASGAGSVASLPWVERNLDTLLKEVPNEKLILGVPLYARLWKEQTNTDGTTEVTAQALSMDKVKAWIAEKGIQPTYDEESGQNYAEYASAEENALYKIWIEDELSLKKRADLASNYQLAGVGTWSRVFGDITAWTALNLHADNAVTQK
ncbi:SH3 domain-containing protein [Neobacillus sp. MM2021_6]|uniref:glycosyl hydrolase family 18 protein n=1 Tax=Bacillaceae TaxID=186817 RepID=UPI00140A2BE4|nr:MULTISPECIES: glycosyl hydrolase family 18 protein [Bacillaceae]MBO0960610.1 SH3 domain-containing protein [Neobacillus sp. MM2021_6]NHC18604.1 SH3 domain-containing protein [Bacillus sp. MM2020_4]